MIRREWTIALVTMGLLALLMAVGIVAGGRPANDPQGRPSTFFTGKTGARALLLSLERLVPRAEQWRRPLTTLPEPGSIVPTTLLVAQPGLPLSVREARRLEQWIAEGGQLILATDDGWVIDPGTRWDGETKDGETTPDPTDVPELGDGDIQTTRVPAGSLDQRVRTTPPPVDDPDETEAPAEPGDTGGRDLAGLTFLKRQGVTLLAIERERQLWRVTGPAMPEDEQTLWITRGARWTGPYTVRAKAGDDVVAIELKLGEGRIVAIADPGVVSNDALGRGDNAVWLVSLISGWGDGGVLIDEFHHGFGDRKTLSALTVAFLTSPWGWGVSQALVAGGLYLLLYRRRLGRIVDPPSNVMRDPLELVGARGGLFRAASARSLAIEQVCQHLSHALRSASGRPVELTAVLERLGASPDQTPVAQRLKALLTLLDRARRGESLSDKDVLEAGRLAGQLQKEIVRER